MSYLYLIRRVLLSPAQNGAKVETFIVWSAAIIDSREIGIIAVKGRWRVPQHAIYFFTKVWLGGGNMKNFSKQTVLDFLRISEMKKTDFCRNVDCSATTINSWLRGERPLSANTENRIVCFMTDYVKRLTELAK